MIRYYNIFLSKNLIIISNHIIPTHKSSDYKLSAVKYYLFNSKNKVQTVKYSVVLKGV